MGDVTVDNFNANLDKSLSMLYGYAKNFQLSIELIQKISQVLKLDTFTDTDAYQHILDQPLVDETGEEIKFQRLSIAGSLVLIDIDFEGNTIHRVSFSLEKDDKVLELTNQPKITTLDNLHVIQLDLVKDQFDSILNKSKTNNIEHILLASLKSTRLASFPSNLKYLANLDKSSDLFTYIDTLALILSTIYNVENQEDDWLANKGYSTSLGKISINNQKEHKIGLFMEFWQDFRYMNHEYQQSYDSDEILAGKTYLVSFEITESKLGEFTDYISETREHIWKLTTGDYQFQFTDDSNLINDSSRPQEWGLSMVFNEPIYLPVEILELIGVKSYEISKIEKSTLFQSLNSDNKLHLDLVSNDTKITLALGFNLTFEAVNSINFKRLVDIPLFVTLSRNLLVLRNIMLQMVLRDCSVTQSHQTQLDEAKNKLKKSLSVLNLDDQILSLQALHTHDDDADLNTFMNDDNTNPPEDLLVTMDDISYTTYDVRINISGRYNDKPIDITFAISNGKIVPVEEDNMEVDNDISSRFIHALNLTEDLVQSLNHVS